MSGEDEDECEESPSLLPVPPRRELGPYARRLEAMNVASRCHACGAMPGECAGSKPCPLEEIDQWWRMANGMTRPGRGEEGQAGVMSEPMTDDELRAIREVYECENGALDRSQIRRLFDEIDRLKAELKRHEPSDAQAQFGLTWVKPDDWDYGPMSRIDRAIMLLAFSSTTEHKTPEECVEWARRCLTHPDSYGEHFGDCVKQPVTCSVCMREEYEELADALTFDRMTDMTQLLDDERKRRKAAVKERAPEIAYPGDDDL